MNQHHPDEEGFELQYPTIEELRATPGYDPNLYNDTSIKYGFGESEPRKVAGGSDATYTAQAGVPSVCSVGLSGGDAHQLSEWADISSIKVQAKKLSATIAEMPADFGV